MQAEIFPSNYTDSSVLARVSNPDTSHRAGRRMAQGAAQSQTARILAVLNATPGLTATEIGARCDPPMNNVQVCRRLGEVKAAGWKLQDIGGEEAIWVRDTK